MNRVAPSCPMCSGTETKVLTSRALRTKAERVRLTRCRDCGYQWRIRVPIKRTVSDLQMAHRAMLKRISSAESDLDALRDDLNDFMRLLPS
jgi:uncharacterized Zn finger protein